MPQPSIICPVCKKDLTEAIALLGGNPLDIWDFHMALHKRELIQELSFEIERFKSSCPKAVREAHSAYDAAMKELNNTRHIIHATQYIG